MVEPVFRVVYEKQTIFGIKKFDVILRETKALKLIRKCHRLNYKILVIQHT